MKLTSSRLKGGQSNFHLLLSYNRSKYTLKLYPVKVYLLSYIRSKYIFYSVHKSKFWAWQCSQTKVAMTDCSPPIALSSCNNPPWGPFDPWPTPCLWNWISGCSEILQSLTGHWPRIEYGKMLPFKTRLTEDRKTSSCNVYRKLITHNCHILTKIAATPIFSHKTKCIHWIPNTILTWNRCVVPCGRTEREIRSHMPEPGSWRPLGQPASEMGTHPHLVPPHHLMGKNSPWVGKVPGRMNIQKPSCSTSASNTLNKVNLYWNLLS